ncbi:MAG: Spy/CpxP family protein refolding chaperone [Cyanobacteria bacterium P01_H01_bin.26]
MKRSLIGFSGLFLSVLGLTIGWSGIAAQAMSEPQLKKAETVQLVSTKRMEKDMLSAVEELDLSEEQQTEIEGIQAGMMDELSEILSDGQMERLTEAQANGDDMRNVMRGLGLSSSQRSSVVSVMRGTQEQIMDVLTPEQQAQVEEERSRRR